MAKNSPPVSKCNDIGVTLVKTWHFLRNVFWGLFFLCATNDLYLLFYRYLENKVSLFLFIIKGDRTAGKVHLFTPLILSAGYSVYTTPYPCITNMCRCVQEAVKLFKYTRMKYLFLYWSIFQCINLLTTYAIGRWRAHSFFILKWNYKGFMLRNKN